MNEEIAGPEVARPGPPRMARGPVVDLPGAMPDQPQAKSDRGSGGILVIGEKIEVKGEIGSCETLVVEGLLEAAVQVRSLQLAQSGVYEGQAEVQDAEIAGRFSGELTVHGRLLMHPSSRVQGRIRYGRIIIEEGGELSGDVAVMSREERQAAMDV